MRLRTQNLTKSYGSLRVLRGVDFDAPPGSMTVILGGSGAGKSVFLKHLAGLERADSGKVLLGDADITRLPERQLLPLRQRVAMIFQNGGLLQSLTVGENVALGLVEARGMAPAKAARIASEKMALVGLEGRERQMPSTLSGGQVKRAAIARALTLDTECLLFDEPTAGLDPLLAATVDAVIRDVNREQGITCVVVTHDLVSAMGLGDRVAMLHEGTMIFQGTPEELRASEDERVVAFLERERTSAFHAAGPAA